MLGEINEEVEDIAYSKIQCNNKNTGNFMYVNSDA